MRLLKAIELGEKGKRMVDARGWREEGNEKLFNEYSISLMQKAKVLEISCTTICTYLILYI